MKRLLLIVRLGQVLNNTSGMIQRGENMSHTEKVNLISDSQISFKGKEINMHDIVSVALDGNCQVISIIYKKHWICPECECFNDIVINRNDGKVVCSCCASCGKLIYLENPEGENLAVYKNRDKNER